MTFLTQFQTNSDISDKTENYCQNLTLLAVLLVVLAVQYSLKNLSLGGFSTIINTQNPTLLRVPQRVGYFHVFYVNL